jgi:hypothetical protein
MASLSVDPGFNPGDAELCMGVRFRSFINDNGEGQVYVGTPDLGVGSNRNEIGLDWAAENSFLLEFNSTTDVLKVTINDTEMVDSSGEIDPFTDPISVLVITLADRDAGSQVDLKDLVLTPGGGSGMSLTDLTGNDGFMDYTVSGLNLSGDFTLAGTLCLEGPFSSSNENSRVEFRFGKTEAALLPLPAPLAFLAAGIIAVVAYRKK